MAAARQFFTRSMATLIARSQPVSFTKQGAVCVSYPTLKTDPLSLGASIEQAFGSHPKSLGIILVTDLPAEYKTYRERLLKLAYNFSHLKAESLKKYEDPKSTYSFGWSHGKEIMNGKPDTLKGSYYANIVDSPSVPSTVASAFPQYYGKNVWPDGSEKSIEGFEQAFKDLMNFVFGVGCELAEACQPFASQHLTDSSLSLPAIIKTSQTTKARLLHYFPPSKDTLASNDAEAIDSWCGFHLDHSLLTGLCSAMFLQEGKEGESPTVVPSPSPSSGLYIRTRGGDLTKVSIPQDCLAFQTGEALELATGGRLRATPHCVRVGGSSNAQVSRETFALFMQPSTEQKISESLTFGQFSERVFSDHYESSASM